VRSASSAPACQVSHSPPMKNGARREPDHSATFLRRDLLSRVKIAPENNQEIPVQPSRTEIYEGHEICIFALSPIKVDGSHRAKYEVGPIGDRDATPITGIIAGPFSTAQDAEEGAVSVAKLAVDRRNRDFAMTAKRRVQVFSAGCSCCSEVVSLVQKLAGQSWDVEVLDMHDTAVAQRARALGVRTVPAVAIDGRLADCCLGVGVDEQRLLTAGLGRP